MGFPLWLGELFFLPLFAAASQSENKMKGGFLLQQYMAVHELVVCIANRSIGKSEDKSFENRTWIL